MDRGVDVRVKVNAREFGRAMVGLERQMPYAIALGLTWTAKDAQAALGAALPEHFTIRATWVKKGLRIDPADKVGLTARVGSVDTFMEAQAAGGVKESDVRVGVPMVGRGLPRANLKTITRPSRWPGAMVQKGTSFIGSPFGHENEAVWQRVRRGKGAGKRTGLRLLYVLADQVKVPARWPIEEEVRAVVSLRWPVHTMAAIKKALETAR